MPVLRERIETDMPLADAFTFVADFANASAWDPGVASSEPLDPGPVSVGARYRLGIRRGSRVVPMEYVVTEWDPPRRVVLEGRGSSVEAVDDIRFESVGTGTRIDYVADIRLVGIARLAAPFTGATFRRIARDAREGMQRALDERVAQVRS